jgi:predicted O-methyltransferase YrrM
MNLKMSRVIGRVMKNPIRAIREHVIPIDPEAYLIGSQRYGNIPRLPITKVFPGIEKVNVTIFRAFDRATGTSMDAKEILALSAIVKFTQARIILEIGTYDGNTTLNLAANSPVDALITTIDLPPEWDGQFELNVPDLFVNVTDRTKIGSQYKSTEYAKKIIQIFGDSAKIDWSAMSIPFDIVFIDACHYYEYVKQDTQNALKYLKSGGLLVWHDYGSLKDVSKVVDETAKRIKVKAIQGTRLAVGFF